MGDYARKAEDYMSKAQTKLNVRSRSPFPPPAPRRRPEFVSFSLHVTFQYNGSIVKLDRLFCYTFRNTLCHQNHG